MVVGPGCAGEFDPFEQIAGVLSGSDVAAVPFDPV